ncbi:hypothetical protein YC2023_040735 [Brassica napus]
MFFTVLDRLTVQCTGPSRMRPEMSFGWNHGRMTDLTVLEPAFPVQLDILRHMVELESTLDELDELSKLSDTRLELNELSNTEDGAGSAGGRNETFQPKEKFIKSSLWDCFFPNSTSPFLSPFQAHSHQEYQEGVSKEVLVVHGKKKTFLCFLVSHIQVNIPQNRLTCESYQATTRDPSFGGLVCHIKHQLKSGISEAFRNLRATLQSISSPSGFCDNFEKGMMKALKDISKNQKKSTSIRAPVAEPSLFISTKSKGKSETHVEELKDFSDSLPTFDEYDE